ncbi:glycosyltransferase family 59 protein [Atractiella rhizophila]|nr:glycosyltransferase family 59 protein [Atractiella rhizophila]
MASAKLLFATHVAVAVSLAILINREVPEAYMDEPFHVPQACRYATSPQGFSAEYDPKLTTPAGLYVLPALFLRCIRSVGIEIECTPSVLRTFNLLLLLALPSLIRAAAPRKMGYEEALTISTFPIAYFFAFLFYTDLLALVSVLATLVAARKQRWILVTVLGCCSIGVRQTNVIWVAFIGVWTILDRLGQGDNRMSPEVTNIYSQDTAVAIIHLFRLAFRLPTDKKLRQVILPLILPPILAFLPIGGAFAAFIVWNGGHIVIGDATNHIPVLHIPQLYYFFAFAAAFSIPLWFDGLGTMREIGWTLFGSHRRRITTLLIVRLMSWTIQHFTHIHPFLLSDNRHYTFYLYRRLLSKPLVRHVLTPFYLLASLLLSHSSSLPPLLKLVYLGALIASLIPTPLLEMRYFLIPYMLWRIGVRRKEGWRARTRIEATIYAAVNLFTIVVFLTVRFRWQSEKEEERGWMRFMW